MKQKWSSRILGVFLMAAICSSALQAKVELPSIFTDNMVLQQKSTPMIWGKAKAGKTISITTSWDQRAYEALTDEQGDWRIKVNTPSYGGPYSISISDGELTELNNVLIGEVWLCSGQSNMEMPLAGWGKILNYEQEIEQANYPQIRLFQVKKTTSHVPLFTVDAGNGWEECAPETVAEFSSVAYFFAREIYEKTGVPVGLINSSWGGTFAQAWTSGTSLKTMPDFLHRVSELEKLGDVPVADNNPNTPAVLYNAMIHPFVNYKIKGALWYQGESNAKAAMQYRTLFPLMINDWRKAGDNGNFPFYFVQLAGFMDKDVQPPVASEWAELRDAQTNTLGLPNTGMAVAIDIGDAKDIHPKNKQEVGRRLALIALRKDYNQGNAYSGPLFKSFETQGDKITLRFDYADQLNSNGEEVRGFAVAGTDNKFYWADAQVQGNTVVLTSDEVPNPVHVRYGWGNNPESNLYNGAGLPAIPFRTDSL